MRISFKMDGGFAAIPRLSQPMVVDTAALPAEPRAQIERLVAASRFFSQPAAPAAPQPGAPDARAYTITIEDSGRSHAVRLSDPIEDPAMGELVDWLRARRRSAP